MRPAVLDRPAGARAPLKLRDRGCFLDHNENKKRRTRDTRSLVRKASASFALGSLTLGLGPEVFVGEGGKSGNGISISEPEDTRTMSLEDRHLLSGEMVPLGQIFDEMQADFEQVNYSQMVEDSVLSCIFVDAEVLERISDLALLPEDFYFSGNNLIFRAMRELKENGEVITSPTVFDKIKQRNPYTDIGVRLSEINQLDSWLPTTSHAYAHARCIKDKSLRRRFELLALDAANVSGAAKKSILDIMEETNAKMVALQEASRKKPPEKLMSSIATELGHVYGLASGSVMGTGSRTGFRDVDRIIQGLKPGELTIIAARPSMGKSAFAGNVALNLSFAKTPTAFFSMEMSRQEIIQRMFSARSGISLSRMKSPMTATESDLRAITKAGGEIADTPLFINDEGFQTPQSLRSAAAKLVREHGIKVFIIDYLQLMHTEGHFENRVVEVSHISRALKAIAKDLNIALVVLSQLNRGLESRTDKRPLLSDLRESGSIEQDSDLVMMLHRPDYFLKDKTPRDQIGMTELIVNKNRNGPTGICKLRFIPERTLFVDEQ